MQTIANYSASELAHKIRARDLTAVEVIEAHIARIEAVESALKAIITPTFERARQQAQAADVALQRGDVVGPLHGVPFTVKDCLDVAGVLATCGLPSRAENVPEQTATVVSRMEAAGAILLGKTNLADNCWSGLTDNLVGGRTSNPWDVRRTVGGSSGGEGAIIAAGGSPLGLGSDIAGSIRMPAHFNGIVGLRPTSAALPEDGMWPESVGHLASLNALGPLARRVEDVALAYDVLQGEEHQAPDVATLAGKRVAYWFSDGLTPTSPDSRTAVMAAVGALAEAGMRSVQRAPRARTGAIFGWMGFMGAEERRAIGSSFGNGEQWNSVREAFRALGGKGRVSTASLSYWLASDLGGFLGEKLRLVNGPRWRDRLRAQLVDVMGEDGIAVSPVQPQVAPRHGGVLRVLHLFTMANYLMWVNVAGLPGLSLPVMQTRSGLPFNVQLVGMPGSEHTLLAAGLAIQQALRPEWVGPDL